MNLRYPLCALILPLLLASAAAGAEGLKFALVGKSVDDANFVDAARGCAEEAKRFGDQCVLLGGSGAAHPRVQAQAIESALRANHFDALAISVTNSTYIAKALQKTTVPLFTFDSPFDTADAHLSRAYIGTDNLAFGRELARVAQRLRPQGGNLCIMTAAHDPNLAQRVAGVRQELSGDLNFPENQRLNGAGGWTETARCPLNSADKPMNTMRELAFTFKESAPNVLLSVGHWPIVDATLYRQTIVPFMQDIKSKKRIVIVGVGKVLPERQALLREKLVHGYVSIDFPEMGRRTYLAMKASLDGKAVAPFSYTPDTVIVGK